MSSLEWKIYQEWFAWLVDTHMPKPHGFIYLYTDPEVCYNRIAKRSRSEESGVSLAYLQQLHDKHEAWLMQKKGIALYLQEVPVLLIDCNKEFETDPVVIEAFMQQINDFCEKQFGMRVLGGKQPSVHFESQALTQ